MRNSTTLVIPDIHLPFQHSATFKFLAELKKKYNPTEVVMIGDIVDSHSLSTFVKGAESDSTNTELYKAHEGIQKLGDLFPKMHVCLGNHDLRAFKRANEVGLSSEYIKPFHEIIRAPKGWKFAEEFYLHNVLYIHGDSYTGINCVTNMIKNKMCNVVFGHTHQSSIQYINNGRHTLFGMNVGCLIDEDAYAFSYAKFFKNKTILGAGIIETNNDIAVPHFIPLGSI
jgi:predicted phosphodiesterase